MTDISLKPMTKSEFAKFYEDDIRHYADENVAAGRWSRREAIRLSKEIHAQLLPQGHRTRNHRFFSAKDSGTGKTVGSVWLATKAKEAFIYDIEVVEELRGRGLGAKVLEATETKARSLGATVISLHVFCHNRRAFSLYKKAGYEITSANMSKRI